MRGLYVCSLLLLLAAVNAQDNKRAPFNSWAGKRSGESIGSNEASYVELLQQFRDLLSELEEHPITRQIMLSTAMEKRGGRPRAFSSWAGKRAPFSSWAGKRSGGSLEPSQWYQQDLNRM